MPNTFFKSILLVLILSLSACSDTTNSKEETKVSQAKEVKKKFNKPPYDLYLDIHKDARMWYKTADLTESSYNIALLYDTKINNNKWAEFWYKRAIEQDEKNLDAIFNLSVLYEDEQRYQEAIDLYKKADILMDKSAAANLAYLYDTTLNNNQEAEIWYLKAIRERILMQLKTFLLCIKIN